MAIRLSSAHSDQRTLFAVKRVSGPGFKRGLQEESTLAGCRPWLQTRTVGRVNSRWLRAPDLNLRSTAIHRPREPSCHAPLSRITQRSSKVRTALSRKCDFLTDRIDVTFSLSFAGGKRNLPPGLDEAGKYFLPPYPYPPNLTDHHEIIRSFDRCNC